MSKQLFPRILTQAVLTAALATGAAAPALADGLAQFTSGLVAPADINGGIVFGKHGEVIPLDAAGKPQAPCRLPQASPLKNDPLPACRVETTTSSAPATTATATATTTTTGEPCAGYYIIFMNGVPVKVWYPTGCTPP